MEQAAIQPPFRDRRPASRDSGKGIVLTTLRLAVCAVLLPLVAGTLEQNDVEFAKPDGKPLLLDLKVPEGAGPFPAAIIVHGGGFDKGDKRSYVTPLFSV